MLHFEIMRQFELKLLNYGAKKSLCEVCITTDFYLLWEVLKDVAEQGGNVRKTLGISRTKEEMNQMLKWVSEKHCHT